MAQFQFAFVTRVVYLTLVCCYQQGDYFDLYKYTEPLTWPDVLAFADADTMSAKLTRLVKEAINIYV